MPVTGFGHRVYRAEDPRARHMRAGVERLSKEMGEPNWFEILQAVVAAMAPYARHGVNVNVDFYSGVVYHLLGIKRDLFVPIFAIGRVPGWVVQVLEQFDNNILIRPLTLYNGPRRARLCADRGAQPLSAAVPSIRKSLTRRWRSMTHNSSIRSARSGHRFRCRDEQSAIVVRIQVSNSETVTAGSHKPEPSSRPARPPTDERTSKRPLAGRRCHALDLAKNWLAARRCGGRGADRRQGGRGRLSGASDRD